MINRRQVLDLSSRMALAGLGGTLLFKLNLAQAQPSYPVAAADLQAAVAERFPRTYTVSNFFKVKVNPPVLRLLPAVNRLGVQMPVEVAGPALRRAYPGTFDLDFALRYEASDLSIRAHEVKVNTLSFDSLGTQPSMILSAYGPQLAEQALQDVILHQLEPKDLALPDGMGLQPGSITVTDKGLTIGFVTKPRP